MNAILAVDSGGYLCKLVCMLIAVWLNASHRSRHGV